MTPWYATVATAAVAGLLAWAAKAWSDRGKHAMNLNSMAMTMIDRLDSRVQRLEITDSWRGLVATIDSDYIATLREHIFRQDPPPPPERPVYPPRPA